MDRMSTLLIGLQTNGYATPGKFLLQNACSVRTFQRHGPVGSGVRLHSKRYKTGRVPGTREIVVLPNYLMVYRINGDALTILRVLHARQQWPA